MVSLLMLTVVVLLGIGARSGRTLLGLPRFAVTRVHRTTALTAVVFLVVHVTTLMADPYAQLRLVDLVLPFTAAYRALWLGLGALALDLVLALVVTSLLRARIGVRVWRWVHGAAYAAWPVAVAHGLGAGTDAGQPWLRATTAGCVLSVVVALSWRLSDRFDQYPAAVRGLDSLDPVGAYRRLARGGGDR
jgi:sulfoxide reductase heme-binding subunit YedZ